MKHSEHVLTLCTEGAEIFNRMESLMGRQLVEDIYNELVDHRANCETCVDPRIDHWIRYMRSQGKVDVTIDT